MGIITIAKIEPLIENICDIGAGKGGVDMDTIPAMKNISAKLVKQKYVIMMPNRGSIAMLL